MLCVSSSTVIERYISVHEQHELYKRRPKGIWICLRTFLLKMQCNFNAYILISVYESTMKVFISYTASISANMLGNIIAGRLIVLNQGLYLALPISGPQGPRLLPLEYTEVPLFPDTPVKTQGQDLGKVLPTLHRNSSRRQALTYVVGSRRFRPDIKKLRQMENAVRDI